MVMFGFIQFSDNKSYAICNCIKETIYRSKQNKYGFHSFLCFLPPKTTFKILIMYSAQCLCIYPFVFFVSSKTLIRLRILDKRHLFNPFMPSGIFYLLSLDRFFLYKGCLVTFYYYNTFLEISELNANSEDPYQTPLSVASDLGLHCLPMSLIWDARHTWVKKYHM